MNELDLVQGCLWPEERALLATPEVQRLPPAKQVAYLRSNRRVGYWVTVLAGGVRLLVIGGGSLAMIAFAIGELVGAGPLSDWLPLAGVIVGTELLARANRTNKAPIPRGRRLSAVPRMDGQGKLAPSITVAD